MPVTFFPFLLRAGSGGGILCSDFPGEVPGFGRSVQYGRVGLSADSGVKEGGDDCYVVASSAPGKEFPGL